jgi:hypothetical protein
MFTKQIRVLLCVGTPLLYPVCELAEFDAKHGGLKCVEPTVDSNL